MQSLHLEGGKSSPGVANSSNHKQAQVSMQAIHDGAVPLPTSTQMTDSLFSDLSVPNIFLHLILPHRIVGGRGSDSYLDALGGERLGVE